MLPSTRTSAVTDARWRSDSESDPTATFSTAATKLEPVVFKGRAAALIETCTFISKERGTCGGGALGGGFGGGGGGFGGEGGGGLGGGANKPE